MATKKLMSYSSGDGLEIYQLSNPCDLAAVLARLSQDSSAFVIAPIARINTVEAEPAVLALRASDIRSFEILHLFGRPGTDDSFEVELHTIHDQIHNITVEKS